MSFTIIPKYKNLLPDIIIYLIETLNQIDINVLILKSGISSKYYHNTFYNTNFFINIAANFTLKNQPAIRS